MAEVRSSETVACPLCSKVCNWASREHLVRCSYLAMQPVSVLADVLGRMYRNAVEMMVYAHVHDYPKRQRYEKIVFVVANAFKHTCEVDEKHTAIGDES